MPQISVIIPAHNAAKTIGDALESVWAQTFADYEIIVVDDCSIDDTTAKILEIVEGEKCKVEGVEFEQHTDTIAASPPNTPTLQHSNTPALLHSGTLHGRPFRLFRTPRNLGPAGTRNCAIAQAAGNWIAFLDGDDVWYPCRLGVTMALADANPEVWMWCGEVAGIVDSSQKTVDSSRRSAGDNKCHYYPHFSTTPALQHSNALPPWRPIAPEEFIDSNPVATSTVTVRREPLERVGGFDVRFRGPEDYDLWMRLAAVTRLGLIRRPLAGYRRAAGSLSMSGEPFLVEILRVIDKAFGPGGVMAGKPGKRRARAYQLFCAAWVSGEQGRRSTALKYYLLALFNWPFAFKHAPVQRLGRLKLLWRILKAQG